MNQNIINQIVEYSNENEPFQQILDDMEIEAQQTRQEFIEVVILFAKNCYNVAKQKNSQYFTEFKGEFNWRTLEFPKFFKIYFTYIHSEELLFVINGFEILTLEIYMASLNANDSSNVVETIPIINDNSTFSQINSNKNYN